MLINAKMGRTSGWESNYIHIHSHFNIYVKENYILEMYVILRNIC